MIYNRTVFIAYIVIIFFTVFYFDRLFYKIYNLCVHRLGYENRQLKNYETVWSSGSSNMFSQRSIFNPDMWYDSSKKLWYVIARHTNGHRLWQLITVQFLKQESLTPVMILFTLDENFRELSRKQVYAEDEPIPGYKSNNISWHNGEDPRIFYDDYLQKFVVQATIHNKDKSIHIAHGILAENENGNLVWNIFRVCGVDGNTKYHKNWSYISENLYLSHCHPEWQVVKMSSDTGNCEIVSKRKTIINNNLRCTTKLCSFSSNSYLTLLHTYNQFYRCVFCEVDKQTLLPIKYSYPIEFTDCDNYVEFPSGLFIVGDYIYIGLGINDMECKIIKIHKNIVKEYLL